MNFFSLTKNKELREKQRNMVAFRDITDKETSQIMELVETIRQFTLGINNEVVRNALKELWKLSDQERLKEPIGHPSLGLMPVLKYILVNGNGVILRYALGCLWYLSRAKENDLIIADPKLELIPILMNFLRERDESMSYKILRNCAFHPGNHSYMFSDQIGYLQYFKNEMVNNPFSIDPYHVFAAILSIVDNENVNALLKLRIHEMIFNRLVSSGLNVLSWIGRTHGIEDHGLTFLTSLSSLPLGRQALLEINPFEFLFLLSLVDTLEGKRALMILVNLYGRSDQSTSIKSSNFPSIRSSLPLAGPGYVKEKLSLPLLQKEKNAFEFFLTIFCCTLNENFGEEAETLATQGYDYGMFMLRDITYYFLNLLFLFPKQTFSDMNTHSRFLPSLMKVLDLFIDNHEELYAKNDVARVFGGGGKEDYDSLENVLELLVQLMHLSLSSSSTGSRKFQNNDLFAQFSTINSLYSKIQKILDKEDPTRMAGTAPVIRLPRRIRQLSEVLLNLLSERI
jgi:hypothetical protein